MDNKNKNHIKLLEYYNCAYNSYLSSIEPCIFLHILLDKILKNINGKCGVILKYDNITENINVLTHVSNNTSDIVNIKDEWLLFSNYLRENKNLNHESLIMQSILRKKIMIKHNCQLDKIIGLNESSSTSSESDTNGQMLHLNDNTESSLLNQKFLKKKELFIFVPFVFDNKSNGLMIIHKDKDKDKNKDKNKNDEENVLNYSEICDTFKSFSKMMGILFHSIDTLPHHVINKFDSSLTFQILRDTLNVVTDSIVITDRDMRIIYKNDSFISMILKHFKNTSKNDANEYEDEYEDLVENIESKKILIDIIPQMISLVSNNSDNFFKNKKLEITSKQTDQDIDVYVNSIASCGSIYHVLKFIDKDIVINNKSFNNSKNHVAFLSHELRNPIQAISTGVYIIDRSIKKIDQLNKHISQYQEVSEKNLNKGDQEMMNNNKDNDNFEISSGYIDISARYLKSGKKSISRSYIDIDTQYIENLDNDDIDVESVDSFTSIKNSDVDDRIFSLSDSFDSSESLSSLELMQSYKLKTMDLNERISMDLLELSETQLVLKNVIKRVNSACKNMNIIIDDILDLSKMENDELIMNFDEYSLQDITDLIYEESNNEAIKKGLILEYEFDKNTPNLLYTDNTRVFQILSNLISNSIKYSNTGTIRFKVLYDNTNNSIVFQISDQGQGIRREEMSNLFKRYGRTSNSLSEVNSTGLGLCVCQKIATLLGGSIEVSSEYMKGSTFTFVHPIKLGYSLLNVNLPRSISDTDTSINKEIKGRILIVDDDPNITSLFKLLLRCMNYDKGYDLHIETVGSGEKAIHLSTNKEYNLIFMDIDLDGVDGCDICKDILNTCPLNKNCPIVAVTANIQAIQPDRDPKFNNFKTIMLKPFKNKDINRIIVKYLSV